MGGNEELVQELQYLLVNLQFKSTLEELHCQSMSGWKWGVRGTILVKKSGCK